MTCKCKRLADMKREQKEFDPYEDDDEDEWKEEEWEDEDDE